MSNWAKESTPANVTWCEDNAASCDETGYTVPITVNLYGSALDANNAPTTPLGSKEVSVHVPWRPESVESCGPTSNGAGWKEGDTCFNYSGIAFNAQFDMSDLNLTLPDNVIVGVAYNTQTYGETPTNVDGPYNSLNVAIPEGQAASVGTDDNSDNVFWDSIFGGRTAGFAQDTGWAPNGTVAMQITASEPGPVVNVPSNKDACKKDGWKNLTDANGNPFKNQGLCVSYVASNGKSAH
jgi:hypothetical protein